ncbi:hypothetical protein RI054_13g67430 [Pseudoscourfieldia marina]
MLATANSSARAPRPRIGARAQNRCAHVPHRTRAKASDASEHAPENADFEDDDDDESGAVFYHTQPSDYPDDANLFRGLDVELGFHADLKESTKPALELLPPEERKKAERDWFYVPEGGWPTEKDYLSRKVSYVSEAEDVELSDAHDDADARTPLGELREGQIIDGVVSGINFGLGCFVDVGAHNDGVVRMTKDEWMLGEDPEWSLEPAENYPRQQLRCASEKHGGGGTPVKVMVKKVWANDNKRFRLPLELVLLEPDLSRFMKRQLQGAADGHYPPLNFYAGEDFFEVCEAVGRPTIRLYPSAAGGGGAAAPPTGGYSETLWRRNIDGSLSDRFTVTSDPLERSPYFNMALAADANPEDARHSTYHQQDHDLAPGAPSGEFGMPRPTVEIAVREGDRVHGGSHGGEIVIARPVPSDDAIV